MTDAPESQLRLTFGDGSAVVRARAHVSTPLRSDYEGGSHSRRTIGWHAPSSSPNASTLSNLVTLRNRSRQAIRNDGYARNALDKLVSNIVGTGIKPLSQAPSDLVVTHPLTGQKQPFRQVIQWLWDCWTDESDADGTLDFYGQQAQACRAWLSGGDAFARLRYRFKADDLWVPLQLQVLEPEFCPHTLTQQRPNGNMVRAGVEFDQIGRRVAYWLYPVRPDDPTELYQFSLPVSVPAANVIQVYDPERPGQIRGVPHLAAALMRLNGLDIYDDATSLRQQLANMFVAFLTRAQTSGDADDLDPLTGDTQKKDVCGVPLAPMNPGIIQELFPGEKIDFSNPPDAGTTYEPFTRQQLYHIAAAANVPYETLTGDLSRVNDRTVRVVLNEFRRKVMAWQHQILVFQFCRPVWRAWLDQVWLSGALDMPSSYATNPDPWLQVKWVPQGWAYIQPVQDVEAKRQAIRAGLTSRANEVSELGEDAEVIDQQQADDNARADALELSYDSDGRKAISSSASSINPSEPPDPNGGGNTEPAKP